MSMTNPQAHNKNKDIQVRRSRLLACGLSLMIGLSGCSDSGELTQAGTGDTQDTSTGTTENQDNTNQETGDSSEIEENAPSDEIGGGGDQGDSESPGMVIVVTLVPVEVLVTVTLAKTTRLRIHPNCTSSLLDQPQ
ncbi:hypothetical protein HOO69_06705 [Vibrio europaeus]|uniref:Uncharacterized protein n=1 Tax=Vibrio europaeus TaxID=300876 RepID=A0AAE7ATA8_9VIBR|nr:hypothetical protein [Vibrio europaeus]QJY36317.1 hypothetical protein HOO69_06705 [Vibrio europaeus]